jgi:hypothetical protein
VKELRKAVIGFIGTKAALWPAAEALWSPYLSQLICNHICFKRVIHFSPAASQSLFIPTTGNSSPILMSFNWNVAFEKECI